VILEEVFGTTNLLMRVKVRFGKVFLLEDGSVKEMRKKAKEEIELLIYFN